MVRFCWLRQQEPLNFKCLARKLPETDWSSDPFDSLSAAKEQSDITKTISIDPNKVTRRLAHISKM